MLRMVDSMPSPHEPHGRPYDSTSVGFSNPNKGYYHTYIERQRIMNESSTNIPPDLETVELTVYTTQRRLKRNGVSDETASWQYHCPLRFGIEADDYGILIPVCYYGDKDISSTIIQTGSAGAMTISKIQGDPKNSDDDYMFLIDFKAGTSDDDFEFQGQLRDRAGEWDWRGEFAGRRKQSRGTSCQEIYGPDGLSLQDLLSYPSMSPQGVHPAQEEASHILRRIIHTSIPRDVQQALQLKVPRLDDEEEEIRKFAPDFLPRAAVVTLFKNWHESRNVSDKQRNRINIHRCEKFYAACAANSVPESGADPIEEFGWDRSRDVDVIQKVQGQYRKLTLACYRLGYRRKVAQFQPFLAHPSYWYKRLAGYLASQTHCERFKQRVITEDHRLEPTIHDWYTQLALLMEAAGDKPEGAPDLEEVADILKGTALMSSLGQAPLDDSFVARLIKLFNQIERIDIESEKYSQIKKQMAAQQSLAWGGFRGALISFIQQFRLSCSRTPTISETTDAMRQWGPCAPSSPISVLFVSASMVILAESLFKEGEMLTIPERIATYLSLISGTCTVGSIIVTQSTWIQAIARQLGASVMGLLPANIGNSISKVINNGSLLNIGGVVSCAMVAVIGVLCIWSAFDRFRKGYNQGEIAMAFAAACDLILAAWYSIVSTLQLITLLSFSASLKPIALSALKVAVTYGTYIVTGNIALNLVVAGGIWYINATRDPIAPLISKYGKMYGLLKLKHEAKRSIYVWKRQGVVIEVISGTDKPLDHPPGSGLIEEMSTFIEMNLSVYRTERRSKVPRDNPGDWVPYYVLAYGTLAETNEVLSPVCYLDDVDIYNCIITERSGNVTLSKPQRNPNKKRDCTFRITFNGGDHAFTGVLQDDQGEWEWKGIYLCNQQKTHLKSHAPQVPYFHSLYEIKKHSPSDTDSSPSSQSGSDFKSANPNRTRGSGGGSYACSIRTSVYGVIPLIEEPDDEPPTQASTPNKYDALIKEWSSISTMAYTRVEKNGLGALPKALSDELKHLTLPNPWPHSQLSVLSPARSRSRMKLITTGLDDPISLQIPRSFTPFTEASEDSFYSIDTEDIPVSSSEYTDSGATVQGISRDQSTPCPPTPQIPEITTNLTEPEDDYVVLYRAWRCEPSDDVVLWT